MLKGVRVRDCGFGAFERGVDSWFGLLGVANATGRELTRSR